MADLNELKSTLSYGCKVLGYQGHTDVIWGHVTLRIPGTDTFLMKPADFGLEECEPENIITINIEGEVIDGKSKVHSEVPIHTEIFKIRPDVNCVVHTHPPYATAFSSLGKPLLPVGHEASLFIDGLPVYSDTSDLIREKHRGADLAKVLGPHNAVLMRNHGITTCGKTIGEGVMTALILEKACQIQMIALQLGGPTYWTDAEEARIKKIKIYGESGDGKLDRAMNFYVRQIKRMEKAQGGIF